MVDEVPKQKHLTGPLLATSKKSMDVPFYSFPNMLY